MAAATHIAGVPWSSIFRARRNPEWPLMFIRLTFRMDATAKRVVLISVPDLIPTVRSRPKCLPRLETYLSRVSCAKQEVVHAHSFSQVPSISEWTGDVYFARQFGKSGPLESVEVADAGGDES